jgi:hypothetical protein
MQITRFQQTIGLAAALVLVFPLLTGCGPKGLPAKVVYGNVTCGGQPVSTGQVTFLPIEGTPGTNSAAQIVNGQYRIAAQGGVSLGKHRVQVDARKKTGRQLQGTNGRETTMIDEEVRLGPAVYAGEQSPLIADIKANSDGKYDIVIPGQ